MQQIGVTGVDALGQISLLSAEQRAQTVLVGTQPEAFGAFDGGSDIAQGRVAAPAVGLVRLRMAFGLAAERRAELLLQAVEGRDLNPQQFGDGFARFGITLVGKAAQLIGYAVLVLPLLQDAGCKLLLVLADGCQQGAVARPGDGVGEVDAAVEKDVLVGAQALHHDAGVIQIGLGQLGLGLEQCRDLACNEVLLVRPELDLPGQIAFAHWADQQRLQAGPGGLRMHEGCMRFVQGLVVGTEGDRAGRQAAVGFRPLFIGWQQYAISQGFAGLGLRVGGRAGAQQQGGEQSAAGDAQGVRTDHGVLIGKAGCSAFRAGKAW